MKPVTKHLLLSSMLILGTLGMTLESQQKVHAATIKTGYTTLKTAASKRNVATTGKYALYTKPGTIKGAKLVASKSLMKKFGTYTTKDAQTYADTTKNPAYKGSTYYFRAYGYKVTNTGSAYYRVVSMNKKYHGYVYGGKKINKFAGGLRTAKTTSTVTSYNHANESVGIAVPGILWNVVPYTQYPTKKLGQMKETVATSLPHAAKFKIVKAAKRTREGDVFDYIVSTDQYHYAGWVKSSYIRSYTDIDTD
ncbi:hypothetical protein [Levilactobacillus zymae]|uniref:hypothetical protein n=1 Tax=Levilactobacillus zymae TaxID=267363 RepID=UPI000B3FB8D8|nr:hypothetical protein [Levilactobacillus zymae]